MSTNRRGYARLGGDYSSTTAKAALGVAIVALITAAVLGGIALANSESHDHGDQVDMSLIVDIENVLSTDMNKEFARSTYGWIPPDPILAVGRN